MCKNGKTARGISWSGELRTAYERSLSSILHRRKSSSTEVSYWTYEDCSSRQKLYLQRWISKRTAFGKWHDLLRYAEFDHFSWSSCRLAGFFVVLSADSCTETLVSKGKFTLVHDSDWLCLFTCSFDMLIVAVSICELLKTSITAFSIQHLRFVSTVLTNQLSSHWKATQTSQKIPRIFGNRRFITVITKAHLLSLSRTRLIHSLHCRYFLKSHINIAVPSTSRSSKCASFFSFPNKTLYAFPFPVRATCPV